VVVRMLELRAPCGNPGCEFLAHSDPAVCSGYCCRKCEGRHFGEVWATGGKSHYKHCERRPGVPTVAAAPPPYQRFEPADNLCLLKPWQEQQQQQQLQQQPHIAPSRRQWQKCASCDLVIVGIDPDKAETAYQTYGVSRSHCCLGCELGEGYHGPDWCCGVPQDNVVEVTIEDQDSPNLHALKAHCYVRLPDEDAVAAPWPTLLFLHGCGTFLWPETIHLDISKFVEVNEVARNFVVIAPLASQGEPLVVVSRSRRGKAVQPERFHEKRTWDAFIAACRVFGPTRVDFSRLCVTGFSMGGEACWTIALQHAPFLAAAAPMAAHCPWGEEWTHGEAAASSLPPPYCWRERALPIRAYAGEADWHGSRLFEDFRRLACRRGQAAAVQHKQVFAVTDMPKTQVCVHSWGERLQLGILQGHSSGHNCWDLIYACEDVFGLFSWMSSSRNKIGHKLAEDACPGLPTR